MRVWRICHERFVKKAFEGEGAKLVGGRWNPPGLAVCYCSEHLSLAALELLVHLSTTEIPPNLVAVGADLPENAEIGRVEIEDLPRNWRSFPSPEPLQEIGARWVGEGEELALSVPSAVIPQERNVLLNPAHALFDRVCIYPYEPFVFVRRALRTRRH